MDELEVRVHEEINDYVERFYGLTLRQIIAMILVVGINVPTYLYLHGKINEDILQFIIIFMATPEMLWGFVKIQNMHAERFVRYWWRNLVLFAKPLQYQSDEDIALAKANKKRGKKCETTKRISRADKKLQKKQRKLESKKAKTDAKEEKKARNEARELARAKVYFGMEETQAEEESSPVLPTKSVKDVKAVIVSEDITEEDLRLLQRLKTLEAIKRSEQEVEDNVPKEEPNQEDTEENEA